MIQSATGVKCARQVLSLGKKSPFSCERNHICFFGKTLGTLLPHRNQTRLLFNWRCQEHINIYTRHRSTTFFLKASLTLHVHNRLQQYHIYAYKWSSRAPDRHVYGNVPPETHNQNQDWGSEKICPTCLDKLYRKWSDLLKKPSQPYFRSYS